MWCSKTKRNLCSYYDKEKNKCSRIGTNGKIGVCWMEKSEGEY